jgi:3D (Asp-Asp-Asp) domain-containing protein
LKVSIAILAVLAFSLSIYGVKTGNELVQTEMAYEALYAELDQAHRDYANLQYEYENNPLIITHTNTETVTETAYTSPDNWQEYLGDFTVTFYDTCIDCCGKAPDHPAYGITASGAKVRYGVTVAVDPSIIPLGSYIYIEGLGYFVAQDTGGLVKGKVIDVYVPDHQTGVDLGGKLTGVPVYIMKGE